MAGNLESVERVASRLRRANDAAGEMLRDKPDGFVAMMAGRALEQTRLGIEAMAQNDHLRAASLLSGALDSLGMAAQQREHNRLGPDAQRGKAFPRGRPTGAATQEHGKEAARRHEIVLTAIRALIAADHSGKFRHAGGAKVGTPNATKLAESYVGARAMNAPLGVRSVREIIRKAVLEKVLE